MMDTIFRVWSDSFEDGKPIPEGFAYAKPDPMGKEHTRQATEILKLPGLTRLWEQSL
jgi:hypothetical protein